LTLSRRLDEDFVIVAVIAEHHGQAGHALAPDEAHLDRSAVAIGHNGCESALGKIDGFDRLAAPLQDLAHWKVSRF